VLGGKTPELRFNVNDRWGNACGGSGEPLTASCVGDGVGEGRVKMLRSASGDTILVPACEVTADFGGTAAINVKVATGSGAPIVHRMEWPVEPRLLAFHRKGEEAPISTLDWGEDSLIGDIYVCVHLPPTDGAAVGPIDEQFSWGGRVEVRESGKPSTHKLTLTGPRTETWSVAAPTKKQKTKTLTARLANAVASLVISGTQGPPAGFKLELDTKHVVAGKPFVLRAIVVDAGGQPYQTRPGQQLPGCRSANGLAVLANGQPRKLRVLATSRNSNEEAEEQLALVSPWVPGQATGQADAVVLVCTLVIKRSGKYAIAVDGVEALLQVEQARSSAGAQFEVLAAAPAALRLEWDDEDGSPVRQLKSAAKFGVRAAVTDEFENVCAKADVKKGLFILRADDSVYFGASTKGEPHSKLKMSQCGAEVEWPKLYLRGNPSRQFPIRSSLIAEWKATGIGLETPLQFELTPSGQPHRIDVEQARYAARVGGEPVEVRARIVCDNGTFESRALKPFVSNSVQDHVVASGLFDTRLDERWWTIRCAAPDTPGEHEWSVCASDLPLQRIVVEVEPQSPAPEVDLEDTQPEPEDTPLEPEALPVPVTPARDWRDASARQGGGREPAGARTRGQAGAEGPRVDDDETESESESEPDAFAPPPGPASRPAARGRASARARTRRARGGRCAGGWQGLAARARLAGLAAGRRGGACSARARARVPFGVRCSTAHAIDARCCERRRERRRATTVGAKCAPTVLRHGAGADARPAHARPGHARAQDARLRDHSRGGQGDGR